MKNTTKTHDFIPFFSFLAPLLICCTVFAVLGSAFCKDRYVNTALTENISNATTIIIDAGHGGEDGGAKSKSGLLEKDINLEISYILYDMFVSSGYNVVMTRTEDVLLYDKNTNFQGRKKSLDLAKRAEIANDYDNAIFISIHMNSFPDKKYSGLQVYYSKNNIDSSTLAQLIQDNVKKNIQPSNNRKIKPSHSNIYVLDKINHPAILIECGFLSNDTEAHLLSTSVYQKKLSISIFSAVSEYLQSTNFIDKTP